MTFEINDDEMRSPRMKVSIAAVKAPCLNNHSEQHSDKFPSLL